MATDRSPAEMLDQLARQATALLNNSTVGQELESNVRALLQSGFRRMDLVSRDEFDAQVAVLARTRAKVDALEKELEALTANAG